jgi:hypothetical protein
MEVLAYELLSLSFHAPMVIGIDHLRPGAEHHAIDATD